jgi:copper chaperone
MEFSMIVFNVNDMTCGHCVGAVTKAVKSVAPGATVSVDLGTKRVQINGREADVPAFKAAIEDAGYTAVEAAAVAAPSAARGGCCGSCH